MTVTFRKLDDKLAQVIVDGKVLFLVNRKEATKLTKVFDAIGVRYEVKET